MKKYVKPCLKAEEFLTDDIIETSLVIGGNAGEGGNTGSEGGSSDEPIEWSLRGPQTVPDDQKIAF